MNLIQTMHKIRNYIITVTFLLAISFNSLSQKSNYIGILPSFLAEPYDTIKALEVNVFPFVYEYRINTKRDLGLQVRPVLNYRFFELGSGLSQTGTTIMINKYFNNYKDSAFWLKPQLAVYSTFTYNVIDKIQTLTFGFEPGVFLRLKHNLSMSLSLQPGINYYPNKFSREFVKSESGFKSHFGIIFHAGYNF